MAKKRTAAKPPDLRLHAATVVPIAELKPHPRNYKKHPADQLAHLEASLKKYGQFRNVVVAEDGTILAGHGVTEAAVKLGWTELTCIRLPLSPSSPEALKLLALDNELPKFAETDDRGLADLLKEVAAAGDLLGTGFDDASLSALIKAGSGDMGPVPESSYHEQYAVMIVCKDAAKQQEAYEALSAAGYVCKVVVT